MTVFRAAPSSRTAAADSTGSPNRHRRRRRRYAGATAAAALLTAGAVALPSAHAGEARHQPAQQHTRQQESGGGARPLQEVWRADFDGKAGSQPSGDDWIVDTGTGYDGGPPNWGTGEVEEYTDSPRNLQHDGEGHLKITALKDGDTWTSSRIESRRTDFAAPKGGTLRIAAKIRTPQVKGEAAKGYWPAFWTLGDAYRGNYQNWPGVGEFDIMENVNGENTAHGVLHCGTGQGGPCNETEGIGGTADCQGSSCQDGFHEYALELDRSGGTEELRWYLDGQQFHSVSAADVDQQTWDNATHHGHFVLLNLAMGGAMPDGAAGAKTPTDGTTPGGSMLVDYVSVQQSGGSKQ